jgi:UDP-N-acetylglucosamine--N-acetylmuramyl-(pentapeptide) pyrophosphoryl-undecaprenol N-acetylglucosamine transferase
VYRRQWWRNARWPLILPRLRASLRSLFERERPIVVVGTGGYGSAPVVWYAGRRGVPTGIQEQNAYPGMATRWLSRHAGHVYLGIPEARTHLRLGGDTQVFETGNPITPPDFGLRDAARASFGLSTDVPTVLITGGSQGALAINRTVAAWLQEGGAQGLQVLWVTGRYSHQEFARFDDPPAVRVIDYLDPMADAYAVAHAVVSRAGAMTVAELCAWGLPSILIPLPGAAADHQTMNAEAMARAGAAWFLPQSELTAGRLSQRLAALVGDPEVRIEMSVAANDRGKPHAAEEIVRHIRGLAG